MNIGEETGKACTADVVEMMMPKLTELRTEFGLDEKEWELLVRTVAGIVAKAVTRAGQMAQDILVDTTRNADGRH